MTYSCSAFYMGKTKTKKPFWVRISEHIKSIKKGNIYALISRHFTNCHNKDYRSIHFYPLDHVHTTIRGGEIDRALLQIETGWIYNLQATKPPGLNEYVSFASFLNK